MNKKYLIIKMIIITILVIIISYSHYGEKGMHKKIDNLHIYFEENELLDASGEINLSSIKSELDDTANKLKEVINEDNIDLAVIKKELNTTNNDNEKKKKEIIRLKSEYEELDEKSNSLFKQYNDIKTTYDRLIAIRDAGMTYLIDNFPTINQYPNYPTGCESVALTLLLQYYGVNVSPDDVIGSLSKGDLPYSEDGVMYGGNPELHFIGNPYWSNSYGVYEKPIAEVANKYKDGVNVQSGMPFSDVLALIRENRPVVVWTSMYLALPYIGSSWTYRPTMEKIYWKSNEHAVALIGYDNNNVIISDPIGGVIKYQSRSIFEDRYNYYGKRAVYY